MYDQARLNQEDVIKGLEYGQTLQKHLDNQRSSRFATSRNCVKDSTIIFPQGQAIRLDIAEQSVNRKSKTSMSVLNTDKLPKASLFHVITPTSQKSNSKKTQDDNTL